MEQICFSTTVENAQPSFISCLYIIIMIRTCTQKSLPFGRRTFHLAIVGRWLLFLGTNYSNSYSNNLWLCVAVFHIQSAKFNTCTKFYCHNKTRPEIHLRRQQRPFFLGDIDRNGLHALACVLFHFIFCGSNGIRAFYDVLNF